MGTYLSRTPGSAGNRKTWTISFWLKRSKITSSEQAVFTQRIDSSNRFSFGVSGSGEFNVYNRVGGSTYNATTTAVHRDFSAWYHVVYKMDTTQASSSNRQAIYVNGVEASLQTDTVPSQDADTAVNSTSECMWGYWANSWGNTQNLDGYLAECYMIDGQALTPASFGLTDSTTGIWKPKVFSGSYGTNGFFLQFKNSGALGTDTSGNGNTWTVNNAGTGAQVTDTPSNNFSIMNIASNYYAQGTFTEGACKLVTQGAAYTYNTSTIGVAKGKWYMEVKIGAGVNTWWGVGVAEGESSNASGVLGRDTYYPAGNEYGQIGWFGYGTDFVYQNNGYYTGSTSNYNTDGFTTNDILSIALDADNNNVKFYKNGTVQNSGTAFNIGASSTGFWHFAFGDYDGQNAGSHTFQLNFGNPSFTISSNSGNGYTDANNFGKFQYTVPSGYYALCTENLNTYG